MDEQVIWKRMSDANGDFEERFRSSSVDIDYDYDADILYLRFGEPRDAFSFEGLDGLYLRVAIEDYTWVGMDILHFRKSFLEHHLDWKRSFELMFAEFGQGDFRIHFGPHLRENALVMETGTIGKFVPKTVRDLVPA